MLRHGASFFCYIFIFVYSMSIIPAHIVRIFSDVDQYVTNITGYSIPHAPISTIRHASPMMFALSVSTVDAVTIFPMVVYPPFYIDIVLTCLFKYILS